MTGRPILVTGAHRSGTGWVGSMIAASPSPAIAYLWEPFSIRHRPGTCDAPFSVWFPYVTSENEGPFVVPIADMLRFRYRTGAELRTVRSPKDGARLIRDRGRFRRYRRIGARPLLKDPIAVFSAGWLCDRFEMDAIVLIRHPAAFANSIVTRRLRHPFADFLAQPLLMRDLLAPFEQEIRRFTDREQPLLDQAILLWRMIHHVILKYRENRTDWTFIRLEDIARDPVARFRGLYARLGQVFDDTVAGTIEEHSGAMNPTEASDPADHHRDSARSVDTWKLRLSTAEIDEIRGRVEPISREFYADADW
jgi:hypothetical protein